MWTDPEVKLSGFGAGGRPRLVVRFHTIEPLLELYKQVRDHGVFSLPVTDDQPTALQVQVLFRTHRRGEEFPATILTWSRGLAVLQADLSLSDFKELTGSLVVNLSAESQRAAGAHPAGEAPEPVPVDTLTDLQRTGARREAEGQATTDQTPTAPYAPVGREPSPEEADTGEALVVEDEALGGRSPIIVPEAPAEAVLVEPAFGSRPRKLTPPSCEMEVPPEPAGSGRDRLSDDKWLTASGSFQRIPTGITWTSSGHFERIPSAGVPREAYGFLEALEVEETALLQGDGTGEEALAAVRRAESLPAHSVLLADSSEDRRRWYFFYEGATLVTGYLMPASAVTALPTLLSRQGLISASAAEEAFRFADVNRVPEETALAEIGAAGTDLLRKALSAKVKLLLTLIRSEQSVHFELRALQRPLPLPGVVELHTEQVRYRTRLAQYDEKPLNDILAPLQDQLGAFPTLKRDVDEVAEVLGLGDNTRHFVAKCLTGEHTLRQLPQVSTLGRLRTYAVTLSLIDLGYVELLERDAEELQTRRFVRAIENQRQKIGDVHDFDFLSVHWSASEREIVQAAEKLEAEFSGPRMAQVPPAQARMAAEIVAEVHRIRRALGTLEARRSYRSQILDPFAVDQAVELLLSNFDMAVYRRDAPEIKRILLRIKELDPNAALKARARMPKAD